MQPRLCNVVAGDSLCYTAQRNARVLFFPPLQSPSLRSMNHLLFALVRHASRFAAWLARHGTLTQLVAGVLALTLGLWGWWIRQPPHSLVEWFNTLFRTLQFITLQFPRELEATIPWQLQLARLAVPLVAALATLNLLIGSLTRPIRLALLPWEKEHIVICGAERLTEAALRVMAARDRQVVLLAPYFESSRREALEGMGLTCIDADPGLTDTYSALNLRYASALFLTAADDLANLDRAMLALGALHDRPAALPPLLLGVQLEDEVLASELSLALDGLSRSSGVQYRRLCPDSEGLGEALREHAPALSKTDSEQRTHVLVVGLAGRWQQVLAQLVMIAQDHPHQVPLFSLVLEDTEAKAFERWRRARPDLPLVAEFAVLPALPETVPEVWIAPQLAVVMQPDAMAITTALGLRRPGHQLGTENIAVLVRQQREDRLLAPLGGVALAGRSLAGLLPFGGVLRPESLERVLDRKGEALAMALHAHYQGLAPQLGGGSPASVAAWEALPENLREANRAAAAHAPVLFAAVGLSLEDQGQTTRLTEVQLNLLAEVEHRRWCAERIMQGWRHAPMRDDSRRLHPSLCPYAELPPAEQRKDREDVLTLARVLAAKA
jgi:hypothetical protein